jgi:enamine deaminase RidA (YjgF/YER057c/UK114 family)
MTRRIINPWTWQDNYGFVQANEVSNAKQMLFTAGIVSVDEEGNLLHAGDMEKQIIQIMDNLETILDQSDLQTSNIVRLTYYTTDISGFSNNNRALIDRLGKWNCNPATTLLGVKSLFHPDYLVEIEAIAVI